MRHQNGILLEILKQGGTPLKITVFGMGYVGLANAVMLAANNEVWAVDIDEEKVTLVENRLSPIKDAEIETALADNNLDLHATNDATQALKNSSFALIATPTDYDVETDYFDTSSVETILSRISETAPDVKVVIKSTVPINFTENMQRQYPELRLVFSPEFLREGRALHDNYYPTRIIASGDEAAAQEFTKLLLQGSKNPDTPVLITNSTEAEAIKLFSNTYLAMRVAFFNELDTFAQSQNLDSRQIIDGVSLDPRIGQHYNNPSFGYGGYCLPKDTRQLLANYYATPQTMITAVVESNELRKQFIANRVIGKKPEVVGIYRLAMKAGSDNFRSSSIQGVMDRLQEAGIRLVIFEPTIEDDTFNNIPVIRELDTFAREVDLIICNRWDERLKNTGVEVFTADIYGND